MSCRSNRHVFTAPAVRVASRRMLAVACAALTFVAAPSTVAAQTDQLVQWTTASGGNGHWYRYLSPVSIFEPFSFATAQSAAEASTYNGLQGYLATITSQAEQDFINGAFSYLFGFGGTGTAWLGASDAATEGEWRWLGGPEAGQLVSYTNWRPGHPVAAAGFENYDLLALSIIGGNPTTYGWVSVEQSGGALGYIIEYGNGPVTTVPEPGPHGLLAAGLAAFGWMQHRRRATATRT